MTARDIRSLVAHAGSFQVGDLIDPLLPDLSDGTWGREVVEVIAIIGPPGPMYRCRRADGDQVDVWRMDDPRLADEEQAAEFRAAQGRA